MHEADDLAEERAKQDPIYRVDRILPDSNRKLETVAPDSPLDVAVTKMMSFDFSQLPVVTGGRTLKGVISWKTIGTRCALRCKGEKVRDYTDRPSEVRAEASVFEAIREIIDHDYVLVRGPQNEIAGIITASDLSASLRAFTEHFLLLDEIENLVRKLIAARFNAEHLKSIAHPGGRAHDVNDVNDLTIGDYVALLEDEDRWTTAKLPLDRKQFCSRLKEIGAIRNTAMHFRPPGIDSDDLHTLRDYARMMKRLDELGLLQ